jgi:predicted small integral membrane protein
VRVLRKTGFELFHVQVDLFSIVCQIVLGRFGCLFKQDIMIFPKLALVLRAPGRLGRTPRLGMQGIEARKGDRLLFACLRVRSSPTLRLSCVGFLAAKSLVTPTMS